MTEVALPLVQDHLERHCVVVGLLGRFAESLVLLLLGWRLPYRVNQEMTLVDPGQRDRLAELPAGQAPSRQCKTATPPG